MASFIFCSKSSHGCASEGQTWGLVRRGSIMTAHIMHIGRRRSGTHAQLSRGGFQWRWPSCRAAEPCTTRSSTIEMCDQETKFEILCVVWGQARAARPSTRLGSVLFPRTARKLVGCHRIWGLGMPLPWEGMQLEMRLQDGAVWQGMACHLLQASYHSLHACQRVCKGSSQHPSLAHGSDLVCALCAASGAMQCRSGSSRCAG